MLGRQGLYLVIIQRQILLTHTILHRFEPFARLVWRGTMGQMAARIKAHPQNRVAGLDQRLKHTLVRLTARVGLHVGKGHPEQFASARDRQIFRHIYKLTAAVIALARIAFGIFVGHDRALRLHHGAADDVFRGDQLDLMALTSKL